MSTLEDSTLTRAQAEQLVADAEAAFTYPFDLNAILAGYTDDIVIRFADFPEITGKDAAEEFLKARFARQRDYQPRKRLRAFDGDIIGNYWDGTWTDAQTGKKMSCRGTEFWTLRHGLIAIWEATFNATEIGADPSTPIT